MADRKITMDKGYEKELADAVKRGKQLDKQMKKSSSGAKKTVKRKK